MNFQQNKEFISTIIREEFSSRNIVILEMILFGSQSRGEAHRTSDWDFLICIQEELGFREKAKLKTSIQRRCAQKHIAVDIIIKSEEKMQNERNNVGYITYYALKNGVPL